MLSPHSSHASFTLCSKRPESVKLDLIPADYNSSDIVILELSEGPGEAEWAPKAYSAPGHGCPLMAEAAMNGSRGAPDRLPLYPQQETYERECPIFAV